MFGSAQRSTRARPLEALGGWSVTPGTELVHGSRGVVLTGGAAVQLAAELAVGAEYCVPPANVARVSAPGLEWKQKSRDLRNGGTRPAHLWTVRSVLNRWHTTGT